MRSSISPADVANDSFRGHGSKHRTEDELELAG